jgi:hypothetical protein
MVKYSEPSGPHGWILLTVLVFMNLVDEGDTCPRQSRAHWRLIRLVCRSSDLPSVTPFGLRSTKTITTFCKHPSPSRENLEQCRSMFGLTSPAVSTRVASTVLERQFRSAAEATLGTIQLAVGYGDDKFVKGGS